MLVTLHESCKLVLTFESVDEILKYDNSHESYWAVLSCGTVYYVVQGGSNFWVCGWNPKVWPFKWKLLSRTFLSFIKLYKVVLSFESVDEILKCDHSNESYWAILSCGTVYYAVQGCSNFLAGDGIFKCDHSNETFFEVLSHCTICFSAFYEIKFINFVECWLWPLTNLGYRLRFESRHREYTHS